MMEWEGFLIGLIVATFMMLTIFKPEDEKVISVYKTIFVTGIALFILTLISNLINW